MARAESGEKGGDQRRMRERRGRWMMIARIVRSGTPARGRAMICCPTPPQLGAEPKDICDQIRD